MSNTVRRSLETLFRELLDGPDANAAWMLNGQDARPGIAMALARR